MNFLEGLAAKRQKLLDGIDANEGDINLRIFEDFYPDEAHFIYELLQNAEDAGASEVSFELTPHACIFEHDGTRHFDEQDIRSITGIFSSSKKDNPDKIGKFGVGFKSVFVYTDTPIIYSKRFSFRILKLVLPQAVPPQTSLGERTRFEFPFNNSKKNVKQAYTEVRTGLEQLSETTLLFLNNLRYIRWKVGEHEGAVLREEHSEAHVEILKQLNGEDVSSSHWLRFKAPVEDLQRFTAPVEGVERQKVAIAFELDFIDDQKSFDSGKPLSKQLKIVPAVRGKVSVFFPAEKETSGLRFHLHAPFVPELSRASIKNSPENAPLFEQLGRLCARSLHAIKEQGLLSGEFLAVLPNNDDPLPERYRVVRKAILEEMESQPLVPTYSGGFSPARRLVQARAAMKMLFSDEDLAFVTGRQDLPTWAIGATQRNSNQDRFLASLDISSWDADDLKELFENRARQSQYRYAHVDRLVITWLSGKTDEWHQALYAVLNKYCEDEGNTGLLDETQIVRLIDGTYSLPTKAYFLTGPVSAKDPLPRVADNVLSVGTKKAQQTAARKFLEKIGVRVPGEIEEIELLLKARYGFSGDAPSDRVYVADLKRFIAFAERNPQSHTMFGEACLFRVESPEFDWAGAEKVFLDAPYLRTGLAAFYASVTEEEKKRWPLSSWYRGCGLEVKQVVWLAAFARCAAKFEELFVETRCDKNPKWGYLVSAPGERYTTPINNDYAMTQKAYDVLLTKNVEFARLVWVTMCSAEVKVLQARYRKNASAGSHYAPSLLVNRLRDTAWVPLRDGRFVTPRLANRASLLEGFTVDAGYKWLDAVEFGTDERKRVADTVARAAKRAELGFDSEEDLQRALAFSKLPPDEQERLLSEGLKPPEDEIELPEKPVRNVELRTQRVAEQAKQTPQKASQLRTRAVQLGYEAAKVEAKLYLTEQYTNSGGQMICQACKDELPFKLPSGGYYFEAVEVVQDSAKRFREGFLALCPNHAAAFQYANAQRNSMHELVAAAGGSKIEIALGGKEITLYFTQMHLADVRACLTADDASDQE